MCELQTQLAVQPPEEPDLKSERVQKEQAAEPPKVQAETRLKSERVQARLKRMPGWNLAADGHGIDRVRMLPSALGAADYATFILREAARTRQKVRIGLSGSEVVVTVLPPFSGRDGGVIGMKQLDFAAGLV
jgi:hypothetical protein